VSFVGVGAEARQTAAGSNESGHVSCWVPQKLQAVHAAVEILALLMRCCFKKRIMRSLFTLGKRPHSLIVLSQQDPSQPGREG
jgi:hypothetical protein